MGYQRPIGVLCARELQVSIKDSVHQLLSDIIKENPVWSRFYDPKAQEIVGKNGTRFSFKGLKHNISEIKSYEGVDYCWVEEAQAVSDKSWETLIPTIRKPNSEIWISFNPKNPTDPTWQRFVSGKDDRMLVREVSWLDNPFFPQVLEDERLALQKNDPEAYEHVWLGKFDTRYSGSVYAKYIRQEQIKDIAYDAQRPIYTAWDLGYDDATSIVFYQLARNEIQVIDYYESNFEDIQHYCEVLYGAKIIIDTRSPETGKVLKWHFGERMDEQRAGYNYMGGTHYVPHDAAYKLQAAQGRSIVEQAAEFGIALHVIQATNQQNSEAALRKTLPMCWFNRETTKDLVHALMSYHYEYDEDKRIYKQKPIHDWSSHGCFVGTTEVLTRYATHQIMNLPQTGEVLTPCGWKPYHSPRITRRNAQLVEVVFKDGHTVKCTPDHLFMTANGWKSAENLMQGMQIQSSWTNLPSTLMEAFTECGQAKFTWLRAARDCIGMYGKRLSEIFQKAVTSITRTGMFLTIPSPILNVCRPQSIYQKLGSKMSPLAVLMQKRMGGSQKRHAIEPLIGIDQKKGAYGIEDTRSVVSFGQNINGNLKPALSVVKNIWRQLISVQTQRSSAPRNVDKLIIESVRPISFKEDVWCLTVPDVSCFSLANGAVVHNCDSMELMARMWTDGGRAMLDIARDAHDNRVHGLRRKYAEQLGESQDPYRMQKHKVKR